MLKKTKTPLLTILLIVACGSNSNGPGVAKIAECTPTAINAAPTQGHVPAASKWLYQLQNLSIGEIKQTGFDILTIDYSADGSDAEGFTVTDLDSLHAHSKTALAYLSIGEAEDYRYYFDANWLTTAPCWLGKTNPEWPGNYKVQYWAEEWQTIVLGYLDKIIIAGFDGVYLDIVDAFEYWSDDENAAGLVIDEDVAAQRMMQFVQRIARHARITRGKADFYVFPQNGVRILSYDTSGDFQQTISGFGIEDLYYDGTIPVSDAEIHEREPLLIDLVTAGKMVLLVDYVDDGSGYSGANKSRIDDFRNRALARRFVPYVGREDRELDGVNRIVGVQE